MKARKSQRDTGNLDFLVFVIFRCFHFIFILTMKKSHRIHKGKEVIKTPTSLWWDNFSMKLYLNPLSKLPKPFHPIKEIRQECLALLFFVTIIGPELHSVHSDLAGGLGILTI